MKKLIVPLIILMTLTLTLTACSSEKTITRSSEKTITRLTNNDSFDEYPSWSPDRTKIVFTSNRDGNYQIYTMNADGTNQTNISNNDSDDMGPSWSRDGNSIAFESNRDGNRQIYLMNADGTNQTNISNNPSTNTFSGDKDRDYTPPSLSPDGTTIVYQYKNRMDPLNTNLGIFASNPDGTEVRGLARSNMRTGYGWSGGPKWSPDGTKIAFTSNQDAFYEDGRQSSSNREIYIMTLDQRDDPYPTRLTDCDKEEENLGVRNYCYQRPWQNQHPSWSPDGTKIVFESNRDGDIEIYTMNADGTNQTNISKNSLSLLLGEKKDRYPSWSPDGSKIVFYTNRHGIRTPGSTKIQYQIYTMNADGTNQTRLTNNPVIDISPKWSADGKKIAFTSNREGNFNIFIMNASGHNPINISNKDSNDCFSSWNKCVINNDSNDMGPSWSPHNDYYSEIVFTSDRDGNYEIYTMNPDGLSPTNISNNDSSDQSPSLSPDYSKIVFTSDRDGNDEIYTMKKDGTNVIKLTNTTEGENTRPEWSPDGSKIVFQSNRDGNWEIYVMEYSASK